MLNPHHWILEQDHSLIPLSKWQRTVDLMAKLFHAPAGFIVQYTDKGGYQIVLSNSSDENPYNVGDTAGPDLNVFCRQVVMKRLQLYVSNASNDSKWDDNPEVHDDGFNSYLGVPIFWPDGQPFGTICVMDYETTNYEETYAELINQFRDLLQSDLMMLEQFDRIREMALNDELTGLLNRRGFITIAQQRLQLARRNQDDLALIYLDMDGLKHINDTLGHAAGDAAIQALAASIQRQMRSSDICARIGGDEFIIMADTHSVNDLKVCCQRIDADLQAHLATTAMTASGISFGISLIHDSYRPLEEWIDDADKAMYACKQERKTTS